MNTSSKFLMGVGAVVMTAGAMLFAQGDAAKVMADMRQALGGDKKLAAVKSLTAVGKNDRAMGERSTTGDYEMALETPDRFFTKQMLAQTPLGAVSLTQGFNGNGLIQETESPQAPGGMVRMFTAGGPSPNATAEEKAAADAKIVLTQKQEFARMALGIFGDSTPAFPLQFTYGGVAEAPDGKADIINVKGEGDFAGKLFVDQKSHLPLMYSWMAKEPVNMVQSSSRSGGPGGGGAQVMTFGGGGNGRAAGGNMSSGSAAMSQEERDKMMKDLQDQMKAAEANRKIVEFRVYYGNYQDVDGLKLPHSFQQSIAGNAASEITIEKYKINPKIDPKKFEPKK